MVCVHVSKICQFSTWQDPVEVTIFHLLKVFILVRVEVGEVKKAKMNSLQQCNEIRSHDTSHDRSHDLAVTLEMAAKQC